MWWLIVCICGVACEEITEEIPFMPEIYDDDLVRFEMFNWLPSQYSYDDCVIYMVP